jgi:hypothetical protein
MGKGRNFWNWLKDPDNRAVAGLLGAALVTVIGGGWAFYLHLSKPSVSASKPPSSGIHIEGRRDCRKRCDHTADSNRPGAV